MLPFSTIHTSTLDMLLIHILNYYSIKLHMLNCSQVNLKNAVPLEKNSWHNQDHLKRTHHPCLLLMTRRESRLWSFQTVKNNLIKRTYHDQQGKKVKSYINKWYETTFYDGQFKQLELQYHLIYSLNSLW